MTKKGNNKTGQGAQNKTATKKSMGTKRFRVILYILCAVGAVILGSALRTMVFQRDYWTEVHNRFTQTGIPDIAVRGNIYDCNGRLLVGSVPEYQLCIDFKVYDKDSSARVKAQAWRDSAFLEDVDSICQGLHEIFPKFTEEYFRDRLMKGFERKRTTTILPKNVSFIEYKACQKLPLLRERTFKGGFHGDRFMARKKPYGSLAFRTLGIVEQNDSDRRYSYARNGIELAYDDILKGKDGIKHNTRVRNQRVDMSDQAAVRGNDLMTTIDVNIQDAAEKALAAQLKALEAEMGIVIVMEAKTGDVKALVNLGRCSDGSYGEILNYAISERMEPGSTFKTASIMVALDDGKITKHSTVATGNGQTKLHGRVMKDAGGHGYGTIDVKTIMEKSSNVGVSTLIERAYGGSDELKRQFTTRLREVGAGIPLDLPIAGSRNAIMKTPDDSTWSKTTLPWMSIGYESLLPPISTCAFYNGIANRGKLVRPRFVKAELQNGKVIREFPVEVLREQMCKQSTLEDIYEILENVVSAERGTGRKARCPFKVCGKTGTAQIAAGKKGYHAGIVRYFISFCGFFPAEDPQYTCFVGIRKYGWPASGGVHCGPVFAQVAQAVMSTGINHRTLANAKDSLSTMAPVMMFGNLKETELVLNELHIPFDKAAFKTTPDADYTSAADQTATGNKSDSAQKAPNAGAKSADSANAAKKTAATAGNKTNTSGKAGDSTATGKKGGQKKAQQTAEPTIWASATTANGRVSFTQRLFEPGKMPDVRGMGARDAVFMLQKAGLKVKIQGGGRVESQSIEAGTTVKEGATVTLTLK